MRKPVSFEPEGNYAPAPEEPRLMAEAVWAQLPEERNTLDTGNLAVTTSIALSLAELVEQVRLLRAALERRGEEGS